MPEAEPVVVRRAKRGANSKIPPRGTRGVSRGKLKLIFSAPSTIFCNDSFLCGGYFKF